MQNKSHFRSLAIGIAALLAMSGSAISQETPRTEGADTTSALPPLTDILEEVVVLEELVVIGTPRPTAFCYRICRAH